jgi:hypothetical protein
LLLPLLVFIAAIPVFAGQATNSIGSGWASVCAGSQYFSTLPAPGDTLPTTDPYINCALTSGSLASVSFTDPYSGHAQNNTASAMAGPGYIVINASSTDEAGIPFGGAEAYGGWNEQVTINGGTGAGLWVVPIAINATLTATAPGSISRLGITAYENHNLLQPYGNGAASYNLFVADNGGSSNLANTNVILFSWDYQALWFGADYPSNVTSYTVNRTVYFVFPFTYGVSFEFGIYMGGVAGQHSSTAANNSTFDPPSLGWGGAGVVADPNNPGNTTTNFTIDSSSGSGFNYSQPYAPEPSTWSLLLLGLGAAAWRRRAGGPGRS